LREYFGDKISRKSVFGVKIFFYRNGFIAVCVSLPGISGVFYRCRFSLINNEISIDINGFEFFQYVVYMGVVKNATFQGVVKNV